ncbi:hypothetical protein [Streptomyces mangrovisoli]|uniref:Uncharacterized protein n=1 Tax=Streptomyces mangrovisoli TaxID=1428628 RepID=A0A1J4NVE7_9ACTN|nr:hypothetical protein [Streptomyces mangrovisoli]OIJ66431.1 hypothetical protein WN71_018110 [Streptomyces mangrovisoli]
MGVEERWQRRQQQRVSDTETREAERVRRHNDRVDGRQEWFVGAARQAFARGDGWFEVEVPRRTAGWLIDIPLTETKQDHPAVPQAARGDLLSRIEDVGWRLHTAQYLYVQLREDVRDKTFSTGQRVTAQGEIVGVYLFQRV